MGALNIWFDCSLPQRSPPSSLVQQPGGHRWKAWTVPLPRSNWEGKMTLVPRKWRDNHGNQGTPSKFHGFILVHLYFILLSILMVKNSDIMWHHLVDPQPCCGNLTLKGRAVLYWTLIIVLGTNQHEINMKSTWNQYETNMKSTWKIMTCNQHAKHQVAKGGIPSNPPLNQLVTSPRFKNLPSASEPLTSQFVSAFFSTKYRTTSCLPASTWDPRHYLGPLGRWCKDVEKFNCRHLGSFKMVDFFSRTQLGMSGVDM